MRLKCLALLASLALAAPAQAAVFVGDFFFKAVDLRNPFNPSLVAPVDPVEGSFSITFDSTQTYTNETSGITLNSLNLVLDSPLAFNFLPGFNNLTIGGSQNGANLITGSSNDFFLYFSNALSTPSGTGIAYFQGSNDSFGASRSQVTISNSPISAIPEPATWAMLIVGFGAIGAMMRRHKKASTTGMLARV